MGASNSYLSVLTEDILEEYTLLTYLSKAEILNLYKIFSTLDNKGVLQNLHFRFPCYALEHIFPQLKFNPLKDRIFKVFSSHKDGKFSFEDMLDLCSVMSDKCPDKVKAAWAFRIYDFDEDDAVGEDDLIEVINRLTGSAGCIDVDHQKRIIKIVKYLNIVDCWKKWTWHRVEVSDNLNSYTQLEKCPNFRILFVSTFRAQEQLLK